MLLGRLLYLVKEMRSMIKMTAMTTASKVDRGLLNCFSIILPLGALKSCECWLSMYSM